LALLARKPEGLEDLACELMEEFSIKAVPIACHCGKENQLRQAIATVAEKFGQIDILVNNHATNPHFGWSIDGTAAVFRKILDTNVVSYFELARLCLPLMEKAGGGAIVNISSVAAKSPAPMMGFYSISKAAVEHLTRVLARELGPKNIRVNAVAPGLVKTDFSKALWSSDEILKEVMKTHAIDRIGEPQDVAKLVSFLASSQASYITGAVYTIDGGESI